MQFTSRFIKIILIIKKQIKVRSLWKMFSKKNYFKQEQPQNVLGWWQSLSSTLTNFRYDANKTFSEVKQKIFEPEEDIHQKQIIIQGQKYITRRQAKQVVKNILWFSYRKNITIKNHKNEYKSDVGWGCLVRVGQMALASALNKYFFSNQSRMNIQNSQSDIQNLIIRTFLIINPAFSDLEGNRQKYSLNKILQTADQLFKLKVGQWFNISSISTCLQKLQNKHPMKGAERMKILFFDQSINIETIFALQNLRLCKCPKKAIVCEKCHSNFKQQTHIMLVKNKQGFIQTFHLNSKDSWQENNVLSSFTKQEKTVHHQLKHQSKGISMQIHKVGTKNPKNPLQLFRYRLFDKELCMFLLTRVGDANHMQSINKAIFKLLDLSICFGIMTGFPRQAIFVVGRQGNKLIYLNPHYVQQNDKRDMSRKDSYICQQYLLCERTELDPSMGFCFYLQNLAQLQLLNHTINYILHNFRGALSIGIDYWWSGFELKDYIEEDDNQDDNFSNLSYQSTYRI